MSRTPWPRRTLYCEVCGSNAVTAKEQAVLDHVGICRTCNPTAGMPALGNPVTAGSNPHPCDGSTQRFSLKPE